MRNFLRPLTWIVCVIGMGFLLPSCFVSTRNSFSGDEALLGSEPYKIVLNGNGCFNCHNPWAAFQTDAEWRNALGDEFIAGDGTNSAFYRRIIGASGVGRMPPTGALMADDDAAVIREWIDAMSASN